MTCRLSPRAFIGGRMGRSGFRAIRRLVVCGVSSHGKSNQSLPIGLRRRSRRGTGREREYLGEVIVEVLRLTSSDRLRMTSFWRGSGFDRSWGGYGLTALVPALVCFDWWSFGAGRGDYADLGHWRFA